jgi:predicted phosphate transport protein (TIGR00153 family)
MIGMERWFMNRRKNKILDIAYRQMTVALDTVNDLEESIKAVSAGDKEAAKSSILRLFKVEEEIDDLRRVVFEEVTKGSIPHQEREDIMHLVKRLDMMADHVKDSARNVWALIDVNLPIEIWESFYEMSQGIAKTAVVLRESLKHLSDEPIKAREISEKVEEKETEVDKKFLEIKSLLIKHGETVNPWVLIILKDLLDSMEEATDSCADTGDYIRVLTVSFA